MRPFRFAVPAILLVACPATLAAQTAPEQDRADETVEAAPASADDTASADQTPGVEPDEELLVTGDKPKKICRNVTSLGSRVPQKVCITDKQDRENLFATREVMEELRMAGGAVNPGVLEEAAGHVGNENHDATRPR